ncbi:MAG TPA: phosphate acyltransferase PlsX [Vicinamibacterales bacterium]|nr:phosphate acyltransferase PlsX [Vicinamibacterales bacterium]
MTIRIAVDAVGGDHGPEPIVAGAVAAARELAIALTLVGPAARVRAVFDAIPAARGLDVRFVDSDEAIGMAEPPAAALRRRPGASIAAAAREVASDRADAVYSAGNTGATVVAAHSQFGMLPGVDRPALAATIPTRAGRAVLLDVGATVKCRPHHLLQFATMGDVYARVALGVEHPRIGLLSIGEEATKGNELTRRAHACLAAACPTFRGNVEARDVYGGAVDVIVCDGFTGNVVLKVSEGLVEIIGEAVRERLAGTGGRDVAGLDDVHRRLDWSEYGGVPLLGVAGLAIVGHGRSSARAVRNGIAMAYRHADARILSRIQHAIAPTGASSS